MKPFALVFAIFLPVLPTSAQRSFGTDPGTLQSPPLARTETERRILATISDAVKAGELYANVPAIDGRMLRVLAESANAQQVLEMGISSGRAWMGW